MNKPFKAILTAGVLAFAAGASNAQVLIGSVQNRAGDSTNYYMFRNSDGQFFTTLNTSGPAAVPVSFSFNIPTALGPNPIDAFVTFNLAFNGPCTTVGTTITQNLQAGTVRVFDAANNTLMLSTFTAAALTQDPSGASFAAQDTSNVGPGSTIVELTSPYVFAIEDPERMAFSFSAGSPGSLPLSCNANGKMNTAVLGGNGSFSGGPGTTGVPEPGAMGMLLGTGVTGTLFLLRRRRK